MGLIGGQSAVALKPIAKRVTAPALAGALAEVALALTFGADPAAAEFQTEVYGGISESFDSDVTLVQPNGTDMTLKDVPWDGKSFVDPPYWGVGGIYWLNVNPNWGLMVDYHHAKIYSELGATVNMSGKRDGVPISGKDRINNTFDVLEFNDGLNQIFLRRHVPVEASALDALCGTWRRLCLPACGGEADRGYLRNLPIRGHGCGSRGAGWPCIQRDRPLFGVQRLQAELLEQRR